MDLGAVYTFTSPAQFWSELDEILAKDPQAPSDQLDYALVSYISFVSLCFDEYLQDPHDLLHSLEQLLRAPFMINNIAGHIHTLVSLLLELSLSTPPAPSSSGSQHSLSGPSEGEADSRIQRFIIYNFLLFMGNINVFSDAPLHLPPVWDDTLVFKELRTRWDELIPHLVACVENATAIDVQNGHNRYGSTGVQSSGETSFHEWQERIGVASSALLYELCRIQKLEEGDLSHFNLSFITHLFDLVEATRDASDETFNYTLIKLLIALNEQYMVAALPTHSGYSIEVERDLRRLPPPIMPQILGERKDEEPNLILRTIKARAGTSKTFGENLIFILNRADNTPASLCVALLILKLLFLLFTNPATQEWFYTNDLCVLVDVFLRELNDLGEDREGLKHTYLRVLNPLLLNTQLKDHPYKRPLLKSLLQSLIQGEEYRTVNSTTKRLAERCLAGTWCKSLSENSVKGSPMASPSLSSANTNEIEWLAGSGSIIGVTTVSQPGSKRTTLDANMKTRPRAKSASIPKTKQSLDGVCESPVELRPPQPGFLHPHLAPPSRPGSAFSLSTGTVSGVEPIDAPSLGRRRPAPSPPERPKTPLVLCREEDKPKERRRRAAPLPPVRSTGVGVGGE